MLLTPTNSALYVAPVMKEIIDNVLLLEKFYLKADTASMYSGLTQFRHS